MALKIVKVDPHGAELSINVVMIGLMTASYEYLLFEKNSNLVLDRKNGNNQNSDDDKYFLPLPVSANMGRLIDVSVDFTGLEPANYPDYKVTTEFYQGDKKLDEVTDEGKVDGHLQHSQHFIKIEQK
jgi:hypothetical protein